MSSGGSDGESSDEQQALAEGGQSDNRAVWIGIGVFAIIVAYMAYGEHHDALLVCYVGAQIITTIGYGDFTPKTTYTRLLWCGLVIVCLVCVAYSLTILMNRVAALEDKVVSQVLQTSRSGKNVLYSHHRKELVLSSIGLAACVAFGTIFYATYEACSCSYGKTAVANCTETSYESCVESGGIQKGWIDAFYFSMITLTTVGFGDFTPVTQLGRAIGTLWMVIGVASAARWVAALSGYLFHRSKARKAASCAKLFEKLDEACDGGLSKAEHHLYLLAKHGIVSQDVFRQLDSIFEGSGSS